jgi:hypothetical protein
VILVDHQVGLMTGVRDYSTGELKHNVVALAKAAKALKLPIVVTTTARDSMWGPTVNAWDDPKVAAAIEATGRKKLIIAGISLEVCAAFPPLLQSARAMTPMWPSMRPEHSATRNARLGCCGCTGGRDRVGLRHPDGRDREGQRAARSSRSLQRA